MDGAGSSVGGGGATLFGKNIEKSTPVLRGQMEIVVSDDVLRDWKRWRDCFLVIDCSLSRLFRSLRPLPENRRVIAESPRSRPWLLKLHTVWPNYCPARKLLDIAMRWPVCPEFPSRDNWNASTESFRASFASCESRRIVAEETWNTGFGVCSFLTRMRFFSVKFRTDPKKSHGF